MNIFEDISSNIDVVIQKCRTLDFGEQLKLASACSHLHNVFKTHIWKEKYQSLNIYEKSDEFVVTNDTNENCITLNPSEFQEFQKHYADKVQKLNIKNIVLHLGQFEGLNEALHGRMLRTNELNIRQFSNLRSLTYRYMGIPKEHLKHIAEANPNLEELCLVNCLLGFSMDQLLRDVVLHMKNLKSLTIENFHRFSLQYCRFQEILAMSNLERLQLTATIKPDEHVAKSDNQILAARANLKELNFKVTIDPLKWPNNPLSYFKCFETLSTLTIETVEILDDNTLAIIAQACKNLETFNIRSTEFENIERFPIAAKVTALSLICCRGLSSANLRHLLTQLKITTFHSKETIYDGVFEGSRVSPCIRSLHVDGINTQKFTFPYRNNNVEDLTWHTSAFHDHQRVSANSLTWCTRLRTLDIQNGHFPLETIMVLNFLQSVIMPQPITTYDWYYIICLLNHPSLKELSLRNHSVYGYRNLNVDVPTEGFATTVTDLSIPLEVFEVAIDFWLDLLTKNKNLTRLCCSYKPHDKLHFSLANLIYHPNFPKSVRNIDVNGFTIDCNDLRWNFLVTVNKLQSQIDTAKCWHESDMYRIVLLNEF